MAASREALETPARRRGARRLALRMALLVTSAALALFAVELVARLTDPFGISYYKDTNRYLNEAITLPPDAGRADGRLFENRPGADLRLRTFDFRVNALGLRAADVTSGPRAARAQPPEAFRILFLGDSVTLAWGVDDAASWVRTLEREAVAADGRPLECLNAGHLQYNTVQEVDWLAAHGPELAPDLVVLTFVVNDLDDAYALYLRFMDDLARAKPQADWTLADRLRDRVPVWLRGTLGLLNFWKERRGARTAEERAAASVEDTPGYAQGWRRCAGALARLRALCADLGCDLVILDHTTPRIPDVRRWCEAEGVPWFDLTFTPEEWARGVTNSPADAHANELGNRLLAEKARAALAASGYVRERPPR